MAQKNTVTWKGQAGTIEVVGNEGIFRPYGKKTVLTRRGETFSNVYDFVQARRREKIRREARRDRPKKTQKTGTDRASVAEFLATQDTTREVTIPKSQNGWYTRDGKKVRANAANKLAAAWGLKK